MYLQTSGKVGTTNRFVFTLQKINMHQTVSSYGNAKSTLDKSPCIMLTLLLSKIDIAIAHYNMLSVTREHIRNDRLLHVKQINNINSHHIITSTCWYLDVRCLQCANLIIVKMIDQSSIAL